MEGTLPVSPNPGNTSLSTYSGELSRLAYLGISQEQSADIAITTAEGDKVTISSDTRSEANLLTYRHLAFNGEGYDSEKLQFADAQEERSLSLSVEGDLNDQELADIQALLKDLGQRLKDFLAGNAEAASPDSPPGDYASLGSYTADFEVHRELTYLDAEQAQLTRADGGVPAASETPQAETPQPALAAEAPAQQLAERAQEYRPSRKMLKHLKRMLKSLLKGLHSTGQIDGRQAGHGEGILNRLFHKLDPQGQGALEITASHVSVKQEWASLHYEMNATAPAEPQVEQVA